VTREKQKEGRTVEKAMIKRRKVDRERNKE
jgi:hypothetical protein